MANCGKDIALAREGSDQTIRFIQALDPDSVKLNDFSLKEWMKFAYRFAGQVNYFSNLDFEEPSGNWEVFFKNETELEDFLKRVGVEKDITPHLALFISFVWLLEFSKKRFNRLTKRHLDFYYREILKIEKLPATPDKVHILFELAKKVNEEKIGKGTELDGGKDANGQKRIYKTAEELIANKTAVAQLKSVYNDHENSKIKAAEIANSYDGKGEDFPDNKAKWWPFGYYEKETEDQTREFPELDDAKLGFALASKIFLLNEGERNVQITVTFSSEIDFVGTKQLTENIEIYCSGEKEWLGPFIPKSKIAGTTGTEEDITFVTKTNTNNLKFSFLIGREIEPVTVYQSKIPGEKFETSLPVCRILFKTKSKTGYALYRKFIQYEVSNISVNTDVKGVRGLEAHNDNGNLLVDKPFYPFGTMPVKSSNFYIGSSELFQKTWNQIGVKIDWKNTPDSFVDLYSKYEEPSIKSNSHFKSKIEIQHKGKWEPTHYLDGKKNKVGLAEFVLFTPHVKGFSTKFKIDNFNYETGKNGPVRISLNQSFYHELFPRIYAYAIASGGTAPKIPNEPYTPFIESVTLNYTASASMNLNSSEKDFQQNAVKFFHEHPFGQAENHPWLNNKTAFLSDDEKKFRLLPVYCKGGELYIGLKDAEPLRQISLLVQVLEGTENPEADSFTGKQRVEWSVLCQNHWLRIDSTNMICDETDNFLKSGIVKFILPKETTTDNTLLPAEMTWAKAKIHKNYDVVCKTISIHAQAVLACFDDRKNDLAHLKNGLEANTISKMVHRVSAIKGVSQPYSSFGGVHAESDAAYYRRISERLRHKNRAVTLWDYEHLILQNFPEIHKVKCLNHRTENHYLAPGEVLIVVIPDIATRNVFDLFQPRMSAAALNSVQDFINKLNSLHITARVVNPRYEEIKVVTAAKFYKGLDESYCKKKLNSDIIRLLSPWAFDTKAAIRFGNMLHRSALINYLEKLNYVDFVTDLKLFQKPDTGNAFAEVKVAAPSGPESILVSVREHTISGSYSCGKSIEKEEPCQI